MDGLAQDLTLALHESSKELQQTVRRHNRKRKGKGRRNSNGVSEDMSLYSVDFPNRSEASASSDLESILRCQSLQVSASKVYAIPSHMQRKLSPAIEATTDSEDQCSRIANKLSALSLPPSSSLVSGADLESDSVNELIAERKTTDHARRRRRAKLNASPSIVISSTPQERSFTPEQERKIKPRPHGKKKESMDTDPAFIERKPKSLRMESEPADYIPMLNVDTGYYDISSESSLLTSDGGETCDDHAGEADDEQSDVFYEVGGGATYGIPIKTRALEVNDPDARTPTNAQMHLHNVMHISYPNKLKRTKYGKYGRPIKTGYRRFKSINKVYQSSSEQSQDCFVTPSSLSLPCNPEKSAKRRRQHPHNHSCSGECRPFSMQLPNNLSWALSSENRIKSGDNSFLFSSLSYRSTHGAAARRRRRVLLSSNHANTKSKRKSGST
ncbi:uncharacterized protein [Watersipora subatra]|uniref:uncharacterized protein n=1 Tax=Watersipora subatra TaxID=2589382 RepID=UPI00355B3295